eukprot:TRINITY_DN876_c1_g1_i1.p2 TRINITY_DN876_c1_g1~~TRINITY_DN876_c1_g1_i1.p2  ORF type:complete len:135 (+),score=4.28 TRINITY_DN876_c1_g1_i1:302-706(+)
MLEMTANTAWINDAPCKLTLFQCDIVNSSIWTVHECEQLFSLGGHTILAFQVANSFVEGVSETSVSLLFVEASRVMCSAGECFEATLPILANTNTGQYGQYLSCVRSIRHNRRRGMRHTFAHFVHLTCEMSTPQ